MSIRKFIVPVTREIHIDVFRLSPRNRHCNSKVACNKSPVDLKGTINQKCKKYQAKLNRCPKPSDVFRCCKKLFADSTPKCNVKPVVDSYEAAHQTVVDHTKSVLNDVEAESKIVLERLKNDLEITKNNGELELQKLSRDIEEKLQELMTLNPSFASEKRKRVLFLNYKVREDFDNLQRDKIPQLKRVEQFLKSTERDVLICIDRARSLIFSCRKCKNPLELAECVKNNGDHAKQVLDETSEKARVTLKKTEAMRNEIVEHHKSVVKQILETYRIRNREFAKHLDNCICVAKNKNK